MGDKIESQDITQSTTNMGNVMGEFLNWICLEGRREMEEELGEGLEV